MADDVFKGKYYKGVNKDYVIVIQDNDVVKCNKIEPENLIKFYIGSKEYKAEDGMIWQQWVDSKYNTDGYSVSGSKIKDNSLAVYYVQLNDVEVSFIDPIYANANYTLKHATGGGAE